MIFGEKEERGTPSSTGILESSKLVLYPGLPVIMNGYFPCIFRAKKSKVNPTVMLRHDGYGRARN